MNRTALTDGAQLAVVTGGSQGMGKSVAIELAKKGGNIVIVARTQSLLDEALGEIKVRRIDDSGVDLHHLRPS